jgi:hypothetical protein
MECRCLTIGVRYCGGCNPSIDRGLIVNRLGQIVEPFGVHIMLSKDGHTDWLLLVNGCPRACLEQDYPAEARSPRCISVEGAALNHRRVSEDELPLAVWETIRGGRACPA